MVLLRKICTIDLEMVCSLILPISLLVFFFPVKMNEHLGQGASLEFLTECIVLLILRIK